MYAFYLLYKLIVYINYYFFFLQSELGLMANYITIWQIPVSFWFIHFCRSYSNSSSRNIDHWSSSGHPNMTRNNSSSAVNKMQHQYWVTKQTVFRKLGKKEDECIVASDAELDAKLELLRSIQDSCLELKRIIDRYQERLYSEYFWYSLYLTSFCIIFV